MDAMGAQPDEPMPDSAMLAHAKSWAIVRLVLGTLQTIGASAGFIILIRTGVNKLSVTVIGVTGGITILSRIAFRETRTKADHAPHPFPHHE